MAWSIEAIIDQYWQHLSKGNSFLLPFRSILSLSPPLGSPPLQQPLPLLEQRKAAAARKNGRLAKKDDDAAAATHCVGGSGCNSRSAQSNSQFHCAEKNESSSAAVEERQKQDFSFGPQRRALRKRIFLIVRAEAPVHAICVCVFAEDISGSSSTEEDVEDDCNGGGGWWFL